MRTRTLAGPDVVALLQLAAARQAREHALRRAQADGVAVPVMVSYGLIGFTVVALALLLTGAVLLVVG